MLFTIVFIKCKGDSKSGSIIYPPRVVPKVEPNTNDVQTRNIWGQPTSIPPQQRISHAQPHCKIFISFISYFNLIAAFILCFVNLSTDFQFSATTHILPVSSSENALLQQQKPTSSTQTSQQQQMAGSSLMNQPNNSQNSQSSQQSQEQNYFTTSTDTQLTDTQQMTSAAISATSPVQMPQNGYASSINSNTQSTQSFTQQQCIGGAQAAAWTARGSNTLTYTQSMQPPDSRTLNQQYCEISMKHVYQFRVYANFFRATNAS